MNTLTRISMIGLLALPLASAWAAPFGYSVNADGGDHLFRIDLANGSGTDIGLVQSLGTTRSDIEGMAFAPDGTLWAADDESRHLFPIITANAQVDYQREVTLSGLGQMAGNDFGMTFSCSNVLYLASVADQSLYHVQLDGTATLIGAFGVRISALAAIGADEDFRLYGLGNGLADDQGTLDNRSLYEIDPSTGSATLIGAVGPAVDDYYEAGLSFDDSGNLWAITDRSPDAEGSQILQLDVATGLATVVSTTTEVGFESLAVAPPAGCAPIVSPPPNPLPPSPVPDNLVGIPTLDTWGRALGTIGLLLLGLAAIRRRY